MLSERAQQHESKMGRRQPAKREGIDLEYLRQKNRLAQCPPPSAPAGARRRRVEEDVADPEDKHLLWYKEITQPKETTRFLSETTTASRLRIRTADFSSTTRYASKRNS